MSQGPQNIAGCQEVLFFLLLYMCVGEPHLYYSLYKLDKLKGSLLPYQHFEHHADHFG